MSRRRGTASLVASPVLIGAVTVLISVIAVFIAYNANRGLPFVPSYDLKAELPTGAKLVKGNEVRTGGFRVGVIQDIKPTTKVVNGRRRAIALLDLKLDKVVEPLGVDTKLRVRPRSALGLKYVQLTPGRKKETLTAGDTIPLDNASEPLELEDVFSTFDAATRRNSQSSLEGFGDAFAGRGTSLNDAVRSLNPLFKSLTPVMQNLADPDTQLDEFFKQIGQASAQVAPVAHTQAVLFTNMADTFAAISASPRALQETIEKSPATLDVSIRSLRVQRPFLADFADLSHRLRPAARQLPRSLPAINAAFKTGTKVLPTTVSLNEGLEDVNDELNDLFDNPNTLLALGDISTALGVARPLVEFVAPYQSVCNYATYFFEGLSEHMSSTANGPFGGGTVQNQGAKNGNMQQPNHVGNTNASRPGDIPPLGSRGPQWNDAPGARDATYLGEPAERLFGTPYPPAIDAQGNADCQLGQTGYPNGPLAPNSRYGAGVIEGGIPSGGNYTIATSDYPIVTGGTYTARRLGIKNLRDVP